jgi:multiple RNA-binding domain-containing protein 1
MASVSLKLHPLGTALEVEDDTDSSGVASLFVKNLNFNTTERTLEELFATIAPIRSITIAKKKDVKNPGQSLSMGYGFVEFHKRDDALKALRQLQVHYCLFHVM